MQADAVPQLEQFSLRTFEKLRYADTDRQGHVNNAVFATMLETGRVEILYNPQQPLAAPDGAFVIAQLTLNFRAEINWPGQVEIGTRVATIRRSSLTLAQALFQAGQCATTATTVIVHINQATRRSQPLTEATVAYLRTLLPATGT